jgi:hypothetical protein
VNEERGVKTFLVERKSRKENEKRKKKEKKSWRGNFFIHTPLRFSSSSSHHKQTTTTTRGNTQEARSRR